MERARIPNPSWRRGFVIRIVAILVSLTVLAVSLNVVVDNVKWAVRSYATSPVYPSSASIAVDPSGRVHVAYCAFNDSSLHYVVIERGRWTTTVVDPGIVAASSLSLDSNDNAHIFYSLGLEPNRVMKYATNAGGDWINVTIDSNLSYHDPHSSIAVDSSNHIHVTYMAHKSAMYATNSDGSWHVTPVREFSWWNNYSGPFHSQIALDSGDRPYITYCVNHGAVGFLSQMVNGSWSDSILFNWDMGGDYAPIVIDSRDRVHVCYLGTYPPGPSEWGLVYATKDLNETSGNWSFSLVSDRGLGNLWANFLSVDTAGNVNIVYGRESSLVHALLTDSGWRNVTAMSVEELSAGSMALDSDGHAHVALGGPSPEFATESLEFSDKFGEARPASILLTAGLVVLLALLVFEIVQWLRGKHNLDK